MTRLQIYSQSYFMTQLIIQKIRLNYNLCCQTNKSRMFYVWNIYIALQVSMKNISVTFISRYTDVILDHFLLSIQSMPLNPTLFSKVKKQGYLEDIHNWCRPIFQFLSYLPLAVQFCQETHPKLLLVLSPPSFWLRHLWTTLCVASTGGARSKPDKLPKNSIHK